MNHSENRFFDFILLRKLSISEVVTCLWLWLGLSIFVNNFVLSWLGRSPSQSISFYVIDGNCNQKMQGIGRHCFGDFYVPLELAKRQLPWADSINPYPPLVNIFFKLLGVIDNFGNARSSLFIYILLLASALVFPVWHLTFQKKYISKATFWKIMPIAIFSAPSSVVLDRGNIIGLTVPVIYLLVNSLHEKNQIKSGLLLVFLINLKPQFVAIIILFVFIFGMWSAIKWITICVLSVLSSFLLFLHNLFENFFDWLNQLTAYQTYSSFGEVYPVNISTANSIGLILRIFHIIPMSHADVKVINFVNYGVYLFYLVLIFAIFRKSRSVKIESMIVPLILLPTVLIPTSFHYYFVIMLPFVLIIFSGFFDEKFKQNRICIEVSSAFFGNRSTSFLSGILFTTALVPFGFSWDILIKNENLITHLQASVTWVIAQFVLSLLVLLWLTYPLRNNKFDVVKWK